jgi:biopolymer transport protein ExbB
MNTKSKLLALLATTALCAGSAFAQGGNAGANQDPNGQGSNGQNPNSQNPAGQNPASQKPQRTIADAAASMDRDMKAALQELDALRTAIGAERLPLAERLGEVEKNLSAIRKEYDAVSSDLVQKTDSLTSLEGTLKSLNQQSDYLSTLLGQYTEEFKTRLHIAELQRYAEPLQAAKLALENTKLTDEDRFATQLSVVELSLDKLEDALGGSRFQGTAKVENGEFKDGRIVLVGPMALFQSADGQDIGSIEEEPGSQEAKVVSFSEKADRDAAAGLAVGSGGRFPMDVTLGNAQKVEAIKETWWEHVQKGGVIMIPMAVLAGAALLVVLLKWLSMAFIRRPSKRQVDQLLDSIEGSDYASAVEIAESMPGPGGRMLQAGAEHLGEPRELIEEVMFEKVLTTRLSLQSWLPFVAICATSAPLLGLLGTVTGIMGTFALMTEFGTGDPKVLSSGISEALITTEHGLIIAIPSLLLHAFLARKAKGLTDGMEKMAVQFMNHVRTPEPIDHHDSVEV